MREGMQGKAGIGKVNPAEMKLARQVIESIEGAPWTIRRLLAVDDAQVDDRASAPWRSGARS